MDALLAFGAALLALRFAGELLRRRRGAADVAWAASLVAYALAAGAVAWGASAGWDGRAFRVYYLFGGLLTAPLLGAGSLLLVRRRWAAPVALVYAGLATGVAVAAPLHGRFGAGIPDAQAHLDPLPGRVLAIAGNSLGTLVVVAVALATFRRRPLGNVLVVAGVAVAAAGTAFGGLGASGTAVSVAVAVVLLYAGFTGDELVRKFRPRAGSTPTDVPDVGA